MDVQIDVSADQYFKHILDLSYCNGKNSDSILLLIYFKKITIEE
jgi:hypothetical protein